MTVASVTYWAAFQEGIAGILHDFGAEPVRVADDCDESVLIAMRYLWLAKFYEDRVSGAPGRGTAAERNMIDCYEWAADFFKEAGEANDGAADALKRKQTASEIRAVFLSALSLTAAQMQANFQAQQMAEIGALGNPGSTAVGYGYATYYTPAAFKKSYAGGIQGYRAEAEKCRQSASACREIAKCYGTVDPRSEEARSCADAARGNIQHLK